MSASRNATPEHWARIERWISGNSACSCLLELRDRIEALEAAASCRAILGSSPAPDGGLVERVQQIIGHAFPDDARSAILAVAEWLEKERGEASMLAASWLRDEVEAAE